MIRFLIFEISCIPSLFIQSHFSPSHPYNGRHQIPLPGYSFITRKTLHSHVYRECKPYCCIKNELNAIFNLENKLFYLRFTTMIDATLGAF
jgi:hypothetical protein